MFQAFPHVLHFKSVANFADVAFKVTFWTPSSEKRLCQRSADMSGTVFWMRIARCLALWITSFDMEEEVCAPLVGCQHFPALRNVTRGFPAPLKRKPATRPLLAPHAPPASFSLMCYGLIPTCSSKMRSLSVSSRSFVSFTTSLGAGHLLSLGRVRPALILR
jgi:hypothetical protein